MPYMLCSEDRVPRSPQRKCCAKARLISGSCTPYVADISSRVHPAVRNSMRVGYAGMPRLIFTAPFQRIDVSSQTPPTDTLVFRKS